MERADPAIVAWVKDHAGWLIAAGLLLVTLVGIALGAAGEVAGEDELGENGWALAFAAPLIGWLLRVGYRLGRRARPGYTEQQLDELLLEVGEIRRMLAEQIDPTVRQLRRRDRP